MPSKSRRGRGKYSPPKKKRKDRQGRPATLTQQPASAQIDEPVSSPKVSAPATSVPVPAAKPAGAQHLHVANELRTIGIIAGIMLIVLIILAVVLP